MALADRETVALKPSALKSDHYIWPLLLAIFMRALPLTMFGPLLPGIARSLGAGLAEVGWIVATYATGSLVAQPVMGRLSDIRGRKRVLLWCIGLFAGGSLLCALSTTLPVLVVGRIVQALGAGGIQPVATAFIADKWPESRGSALGALYGAFGIGTMAGALLGGTIVDGALWIAAHGQLPTALRIELGSFPWHVVFWVNVALAAVTFASASTLPDDERLRASEDRSGFDYLGITIVAAFTIFIMVAATANGIAAVVCTITAVGCIPFLFVWEARAKAPLFDPSLFGNRGLNLVFLIAFLFGVPSFTLTIYSATYFITQFNATEAQSGLALFGLATAYVAGAIAGGRAVRIAGAKAPLALGLACSGAALAVLAGVETQPAVVAAMVLGGLGLGFVSAPPNVLLLDYASKDQAGGVTGVGTMLATSGSITAPAVVSAFLHFGRGSTASNLRAEFAVGTVICVICALLVPALPRGKSA
jgi:MFS family permease